jgi:glycosyltransferase involved in cell wall biosynthesis
MNIGFDAKRAYQNSTGLGHYSRTLIASLAKYYPQNGYYLFTPKITPDFDTSPYNNLYTVLPKQFPSSLLKSFWRSNWIKKDLQKNKLDIYHGLSHEIPFGIAETGIKSVVTIHDLIFERYPEQYKIPDRIIYRNKFKYACRNADAIIAISLQTKQDIIDYYKIPEQKITVCYQSCNPAFAENITPEKKEAIRRLYDLPPRFYLYVGSIIERKNLLLICKALKLFNNSIPLVIIGNGREYKRRVKKYLSENKLDKRVIFLSEKKEAIASSGFQSAADFPAIYQMALAMIYPSIFEGFGIPVLEAMCSRLPVITSNVSCLPETGGNAALYVNPSDEKELAAAMQSIAMDNNLRDSMIEKGILHSLNFTPQKCAASVMHVYESL